MASPTSRASISPILDPIQSIVLMFALTQVLGLTAGILLLQVSLVQPVVQQLSVAPTGQADDPLNAVYFIFYVLAGAGAVLLTLRFFKGGLLFRFLEFFVLSGSISILALAYLMGFAHFDFISATLAAGAFGTLFAAVKFFIGQLKNPAAILSSAGVGALFGFSMGFWPALAFVLLLSLYDYIAVFKTRHMLQMASALGSRNLSFTITAQSKPQNETHDVLLAPSETETKTLSRVSPLSSAAQSSRAPPSPTRSSGSIDRLDLGSGDLAIPAMLSVSSYPVAGLAGSLAVAVGTTFSIYFLLQFVVRQRVALPALPPICLGGLLALLVVKLLGA